MTPVTCPLTDRVYELLEPEHLPPDAEHLEAHTEHCPACAATLRDAREFDSLYAGVAEPDVTLDEPLRWEQHWVDGAGVVAPAPSEPAAPPPRRPRRRAPALLAGVALALGAAALGAHLQTSAHPTLQAALAPPSPADTAAAGDPWVPLTELVQRSDLIVEATIGDSPELSFHMERPFGRRTFPADFLGSETPIYFDQLIPGGLKPGQRVLLFLERGEDELGQTDWHVVCDLRGVIPYEGTQGFLALTQRLREARRDPYTSLVGEFSRLSVQERESGAVFFLLRALGQLPDPRGRKFLEGLAQGQVPQAWPQPLREHACEEAARQLEVLEWTERQHAQDVW